MADSQEIQDTAALTQRWQDAISSIVHELKSPVTSLATLLQTLEQRMQQPQFNAAKDREFVQMSLKQVERLTLLINDLLDVSRTGQGLQYNFQRIAIAPLVRSLVQSMIASNPSHTFILEEGSDAIIHADPLRIEQALVNIIVNATKYSPANTTITMTLSEQNNKVRVAVSDEGIGITPEQEAHLFDLYYRAPNTTSVKGLGIGLPLSYGIIKAHNGDIEVSSIPGNGTTFTITLPISDRTFES